MLYVQGNVNPQAPYKSICLIKRLARSLAVYEMSKVCLQGIYQRVTGFIIALARHSERLIRFASSENAVHARKCEQCVLDVHYDVKKY